MQLGSWQRSAAMKAYPLQLYDKSVLSFWKAATRNQLQGKAERGPRRLPCWNLAGCFYRCPALRIFAGGPLEATKSCQEERLPSASA